MSKQNLKSVEKFNPNSSVKISSVLYDIKKCRMNMSTHGFRMLFALAQGITQTNLFSEYTIPKNAMFKYLGIDNTGRKHELLADTLKEVMSKGLEIRTTNKKNGKRTWEGMAWITGYKFSEENNHVWIKINEDARPYLFAVQQFGEIKPKYYLNLDTSYQNWAYPLFKKAVNIGRWEMTIDEIREALDLNKIDSYNKKKSRNANMNVLRWVLGIEPNEAAKAEPKLAKAEKRPMRMIPWDYIKDKKGNPTGTLASITEHTDINVRACVLKEGGSYNRVVFLVDWKVEEMTPGQRKKMEEKIRGAAEMDMGKRQDMANREAGEGILSMPAQKEPELPKVAPQFYEFGQLFKLAHEAGFEFDEFVKAGRFEQHTNGKWYRR